MLLLGPKTCEKPAPAIQVGGPLGEPTEPLVNQRPKILVKTNEPLAFTYIGRVRIILAPFFSGLRAQRAGADINLLLPRARAAGPVPHKLTWSGWWQVRAACRGPQHNLATTT